MDLPVKDFINGLLSDEALSQPSDSVKPEELVMELPPWFDEKKFNKGRKFFWSHCFGLATTMFVGLVTVFAVPSILKVLVGSRRSSSVYTAYKRYLSTLLHTMSWFEHELKPGSKSWRSLYTVRSRHLRAGLAAKLQGHGAVSQRDMALTQFGFFGFALLCPTQFGLRALTPDDWETYIYFWRVIGYMIGIEDRYNISRKTLEETREVCQIILDRVFTPCLDDPPEYFEHMSRVMLDGMWYVNPTANGGAVIYFTKYLAKVPGYIYTENERIHLQDQLKKLMLELPKGSGVDSKQLINKPAIGGLRNEKRILQYHDYDVFDDVPAYKNLTWLEKYKLNFTSIMMVLYNTYLGRIYFNLNFLWSLFLMKYCPYMAFFKFGIKNSLVNIFVESPSDDTKPLPNSEFSKPQAPQPLYKNLLSLIW